MGRTRKYKDYLVEELKNPDEAAAYLNACLNDEDPHVFLLALKGIENANGGISN